LFHSTTVADQLACDVINSQSTLPKQFRQQTNENICFTASARSTFENTVSEDVGKPKPQPSPPRRKLLRKYGFSVAQFSFDGDDGGGVAFIVIWRVNASMIRDYHFEQLTDYDRTIYDSVVPADHFLVDALEAIHWDSFVDLLTPYYSEKSGRPARTPLVMLKLEYLRYQYNLSDRDVISRAETDLAFRQFLQIRLTAALPHPTLLCQFRGRLGQDGFRKVFDRVVAEARENGFVKDRLRIKDATHVIGNLAVPTALALMAQSRDKLLSAAKEFAPEMVEGELASLELLRDATKALGPTERLVTRVSQLKDILFWCDELEPPSNAQSNRLWQQFLAQRDLAHKILDDQDHPGRGNRTLSTTDPDARRSMHGDYFDGYFVDILIDPESEIITQINVLSSGGEEAADALELIRLEEAAHGNDIEALSIDGAGFNGPVLRELEDADGLDLDTYVPVPSTPDTGRFTPLDFSEDSEAGVVTCPAGETSHTKYYDKQKRATKYEFAPDTCSGCSFRKRCMKKAPSVHKGRTVSKSDYQVEHQRARAKTATAEYAAVRKVHPRVERKLGEMMNRHGGRFARYRGKSKVLMQQLMVGAATNIKRIVRLNCAPTTANA